MKKFISLALVAVMLMASFVITANAATPFGTVVEVPYSETAPDMNPAAPDASWGDPITHIDGKSPNAGIINYIQTGVPDVRQDISFDLYAKWTDTTLYLCFVSPDKELKGDSDWYSGDGVQMVVYPGIIDISYCNYVSAGWTTENEYYEFDWTATLDWDDDATTSSPKAEDRSIVFIDDKNSALVVKFEMPFIDIGFGKKEVVGEGSYISFSLVRCDKSKDNATNCGDGWLEWGDFYDAKKGWNPEDKVRYVPCCENTKTTTANTFKLVGKSGGTTEQPVEPETPTEPETPVETKEQPSEYAKAEVAAAIEAELVPENLQKDYEKATTRGAVAQMFVNLLEKASGKSVDEIMKEKGVAINEKAFTDTTDKAVLAANALGIINGVGDGKFDPNGTLKRAQIAAIINRVARVMGVKTEGYTHSFTDITGNYTWVDAELGWPVNAKIINGVGNNKFSPDGDLKTQDAILITYRALNALKK